ncbi:MAG: nickel pincer cofactor biosynthesis protein LarC [Oscillospiraceae bacterium]|nr:nickel pincer cofactor biosynthesis protein LarC [Oscillospiraceae bacterium]
MKTLYLDCSMGAAGDMLVAALLELLPDRQSFVNRFNALGIPGVTVSAEPAVKCGVTGTHFRVSVNGAEEDEHHHEHHHHHSGMHDITQIVESMRLDPAVEADVLAVYRSIAEAESQVHGEPIEQIHFHEVGTMDAIADVTAVCLLMHELSPDAVIASPVNVGGGTVHCAHGILPVPAPATALLLRDIPMYGGTIQSELCTPTGAALLRRFVTKFGAMPLMRGAAYGYGMGKKDFEQANCVRAILGESEGETEEIIELSCDVDDMTGEEIGFAAERLFELGARDVYTMPVQMKKGRPGVLLRVLCMPEQREALVEAIFRHTTTLGVREARLRRHVMERSIETLDTPCGQVRRKTATGYGVERGKLEYEDLARVARERNISLAEARRLVSGENE